MNGTPAWLLANGFTKKSIDGLGSVKGAPCTINSIVDNGDGTHTVIFSWTSNSGVTQTSNLIVKDGKNGVDGTNGVDVIQIASITATEDNKILVTMEDGTEHETAVIPTVKGEDGKSAEITVERVANGVKITGKDEEHGETVATAQDVVENILEKFNNNFSTTGTEVMTSVNSYTVTNDVVLVKSVLATTEAQYSGSSLNLNGNVIHAIGANSAGAAISNQISFKAYKGDVLSKIVNSPGGSCRVYIYEKA